MTAAEAVQHLPPPHHFIDGNYTEEALRPLSKFVIPQQESY